MLDQTNMSNKDGNFDKQEMIDLKMLEYLEVVQTQRRLTQSENQELTRLVMKLFR